MDRDAIVSAVLAAALIAGAAWFIAGTAFQPWLLEVGQSLGAMEVLG